ncbi:membrane protein [Streptomyces sp. NRRL S-1448]|uniref:membrane protein n=1 Tax=Streptomyces sp. NRRL S-1448 TaxID=1463883 RepID=UPI00056428D4|nr:membrane protein [Streptomyces sp. NRRL S-1448]
MHLVLLTAWTALWFAVVEPHGGFSWHYLRTGGELIYQGTAGDGTGGLNLYAHHPELQMGPISFLTAGLFNPFPEATGQFLAAALMSLLGLVIVVLAGRSAAHHFLGTGTNHQRLRQRVLIAGLAFIPMWIEVAVRFGHLDDVLALFFTALAVRAVTRGDAALTGVFLALAMDSKPTALAFVPLLLALPREKWLRAGLWCAGLVAVAWLPFFLGDPQSFAAAKFAIPNHPASALRWLGVGDPETPGWDRPAQAALGLTLGTIAVWRGRWAAVVLLGANARIVLDPSVYTYYTASVLLGTLLWDVIGQRRLVPWWSWLALLILYGSVFAVPDDSARGLIRLGFVALSTAYVLLWPVRERGERGRGRGRRRPPARTDEGPAVGNGATPGAEPPAAR